MQHSMKRASVVPTEQGRPEPTGQVRPMQTGQSRHHAGRRQPAHPAGPGTADAPGAGSAQMTPKAIIASATLRKPATFAPST